MKPSLSALSPALVTGALLIAVVLLSAGHETGSTGPRASASNYGKLPLAFEANGGRLDPRIDFLARGPGYSVALSPRRADLTVGSGRRASIVRTRLVGASPTAHAVAGDRLPGTVNSLVGGDPRRWRTGIPTFGSVRYESVYPGVDLVYYGNQRRLEYDFVVRPGASPDAIALAVSGARRLRMERAGSVAIPTRGGTLRQLKPIAYQEIGGRRVPVDARWKLDAGKLSFRLGHYDPKRALIIDPVLSYSTFLGGSGNYPYAIAVDASGSAYVAGSSSAASISGSQANSDIGAGGSSDAFVFKLNPAGTAMLYSTFIGGTDSDYVKDIAVDSSGAAYIAGATFSTSATVANRFPTAGTGADTTPSGSMDAFVAKLSPAGDALDFSTFLGGSSNEIGYGIAYRYDTTNNRDEIYVAGSTPSTDFPVTTDTVAAQAAYQTTKRGDGDAFLTKYTWNGSSLVTRYSTYLGGDGTCASGCVDYAQALDVDSSGTAYVAGFTRSTNYPTTAGVLQATDPDPTDPPTGVTPSDGEDGFVAKLDPTLNGAASLVWSTYIGGSLGDLINAIAVTPGGSPIVVGETRSNNLPAHISGNEPFPDTNAGGVDAFIVQLGTDGTSASSTYLGGSGDDRAHAVAVHQVSEPGFGGTITYTGVYVTGETKSGNFPEMNPLQGTGAAGNYNAFVAKWTTGNIPRVAYSTYLGGLSGTDYASAIAVDSSGRAYVAGRAGADFSATSGAFRTANSDSFAARIDGRPPRIAAGPSGPVNTTGVSFTYDTGNPAEQNTNGFDCSLDGAAFAGCGSIASTKTYSGLAQGAHTFDVRLKDAAKAPSDPVRRSFTVDTVAPEGAGLIAPAADDTVITDLPAFSWRPTADATTSIASYRLIVDDAQNRSIDTCSAEPCNTTPAAPLGQGAHKWRIDAVDQAGNVGSSETRAFTVQVPPTAKLVVNPNPALVGRTVTFDGSGSPDATHTIAKYEWDLDGDGRFETDTGTADRATHSYDKPATVNVALRVTDSSGQVGTATVQLKITSGVGAQTLFGVSIDAGAQYTRSPDVVVTSTFPAATTSIVFSNDGGFFKPAVFAPAKETKWKLDSSGPERLPKTIYVRFLTGPFISETYQDDIILDETPPKVDQAAVVPAAASPASVVHAAQLRSWKLKVKASDSNSGVARIQATSNKKKPGKLLKYKRKLTVKSAARPKWVRARDRAGNYSRWRKAR